MKSQEIQRNYDKEPLVIQDYNTLFAFIPNFFLIPLLIYIYIYNPGGTSEGSLIRNVFVIIPLMMYPYINTYLKARRKRKVVLTNNNITFYHQDKIIEQIAIDKITEIKKTYSDVYHKSQLRNKDFAYLSAFVFVPLLGYYTDLLIEFVIIFLFVHLYSLISKLVFQVYKTKKLPTKLFDAILIFEDDNFINILPTNEDEYDEVKKYLLSKNLGQIENKKIYFELLLHMYEKIELE